MKNKVIGFGNNRNKELAEMLSPLNNNVNVFAGSDGPAIIKMLVNIKDDKLRSQQFAGIKGLEFVSNLTAPALNIYSKESVARNTVHSSIWNLNVHNKDNLHKSLVIALKELEFNTPGQVRKGERGYRGVEVLKACDEGDWVTLEKLIQDEADLNAVDGNGNSGLMRAVHGGHLKCEVALIRVRAKYPEKVNLEQKNKGGHTALVLAFNKWDTKSINLLLWAGASTEGHGRIIRDIIIAKFLKKISFWK